MITLSTWAGTEGLAGGTTEHLLPDAAGVVLGPDGSPAQYADPFGDGTPVAYETGTWTSPALEAGYPVHETVVSWNAVTPTGTWVEVQLQGRLADGRWTRWFVLGRWASGADHAAGDVHRASVTGQDDEDAAVSTDTYVARAGREPVAFRTRVVLHRPAGSVAGPGLRQVAVLTTGPSSGPAAATSAFTLGRHVELDVPAFSQLVHSGEYPEFGGGGTVWCSPTSVTMVQYFYGHAHAVPAEDLTGIDAPADPQIAHAALGTWDHAYGGAGNWAFSTAYAHRFGLVGFVTRLRSLAEAERFVEAGIPLVLSGSWAAEDLPEAGYSTEGHLFVLVGFTADGDAIVNDPNRTSDDLVRGVYPRANLERVWQRSTRGLTYVVRPVDLPLPQNVPGLTPNW
ncbi:C39 family peptidase [Antribacter gilvus]|uniref:C39 family peptidase n=1 Tax=Antribacter gilvus TaxID=2304675 RepID=UPI000F768C87|nr:C39 family peptidase [Antribacter gilvus]